MSEPQVFSIGDDVLDDALVQDIDEVAVEDFEGSTFEELPSGQKQLFLQVVQDLKTTRIEDNPDVDDNTNIERLLQLSRVLQLAVIHGDHQQEKLRQDFDEIQAELTRRDETDPVQLLEVARLKDNENKQMLKNESGLKTKLDESNTEINRLEELNREQKKRIGQLQDELRERDENQQGKDEDLRDLKRELDELRKNAAASVNEEDTHNRLMDQKNLLQRRLENYQKTQQDLKYQLSQANKRFKDLQHENDEDKQKLVELYDTQSVWKQREAELESKNEDLLEERELLQDKVEDLKNELEDKIVLIEELSTRFERQYNAWEQEREAMTGQMEAMQQGAPITFPGDGGPPSGMSSLKRPGGGTLQEESVEALREELNVMREEQVVLLEAYEVLENDLAREVDKAVEEQATKLEDAESKLKVTEEELTEQLRVVKELQDQIESLQTRTEEAEELSQKLMSGDYGLVDAVQDVKLLKERLKAEEKELGRRVDDINRYAEALEQVLEENAWLKRKAGLPEDITIDMKDLKLARQGQMMQLKAMNNMLEEENMRLEEDVRRLKHEVRFRTKWEGMTAAGLGLTPEQLQLLELKAEQIKFGRVDSRDEELLRLQNRIKYLEGRLAEAQAMCDLPEDMRDFGDSYDDGGRRSKGGVAASEEVVRSHERLLAAVLEALGGIDDARDILPSRHADVHAMLKEAAAVLKKAAADAKKATAGERPHTAASPGTPSTKKPATVPMEAAGEGGGMPVHVFMSDVLADAQADKLREKMKQMASQLAELHSIAEQKNALLEVAEKEKAELVKRLRAGGAGLSDAAGGGMVSREEYNELLKEANSYKAQLVECLEEQSLKEREINAIMRDMDKYRQKFQGFEDQKRLLYREYVREVQQWRTEREGLTAKVNRLLAERDEAKAAAEEYRRGVETVTRGTEEEVRAQYGDAVRRMALAAMRSARLARELESSSQSEKSIQREKAELEAEISDMGSTLRTRMRYLDRAKEAADRRVGRLYRELDLSVPAKAYEMLVEKYGVLQRSARQRMEDSAEGVMREEELLRLRDDVAELTKQVFELVDECAHFKEAARQAERRLREARPSSATSVGLGAVSSSRVNAAEEDVAELVKLRVEEGNARKRAELEASKARRAAEGEADLKARLSEVEKQLADSAAELHALAETNKLYRDRLSGAIPSNEATAMNDQMDVLRAAASGAESALSEAKQNVRELEEGSAREKRSQTLNLATITQLRTALREIACSTDTKATLGKLHEEITHVRSKEACIRNQLIRSEQERIKLQDENSSLRRELAGREATVGSLQDHAHFVARERQELLLQLQAGLQGRVEAWRAERWRRKLEDVKSRNDVLAGDLDVSRRRVQRLEEHLEKAELQLEAVTSLEEILARPMAESFRQCAYLTEQSLHQRLETSKVRRELGLQTEKVRYQERVIAELEARLEDYEAEAFRLQSTLEGEKLELLNKNRSLEEQLLSLSQQGGGDGGGWGTGHGRASTIMASLQDGHHLLKRRTERLQFLGRAEEDREALLDGVEAMRAVKQELAEAQTELKAAKKALADQEYSHGLLKVEYEDLVGQMARERERRTASDEALAAVERKQARGADGAVQQVRAAAEKRIGQLERKAQDQEEEAKAAAQRMDEMRSQYLLQHERDREEIERLNDILYDRNESTINDMRNGLNTTKGLNFVTDETERAMTYDQLQRLLDQRESQLEHIRNQLEQIARQYELANAHHREEAAQKDTIAEGLKAELKELHRTKSNSLARHHEVQKLKKELTEKGTLLKELRTALKTMEQQMISAEADRADDRLRKLTLEEMEIRDRKVAALEKESARLGKQLNEERREASRLRQDEEGLTRQLAAANQSLKDLQEKLDKAQTELNRERKKVRDLKNQRDTAGMLNTELQRADPKVAGVLENRVQVLEAQNARLRAMVDAERGPMEEAAALAVADEQEMSLRTRRTGGGGGGTATEGEDGPGGGGGRGTRSSTVKADHSGSDARVKQWEENKKLQDRIQKLRDALGAKAKAAEELAKDRDKKAAQLAALHGELKRTKELLAESRRGGGGGGGGRLALSEPQKMRELVAEANAVVEERDGLAREVQRL
eukprot:CAMPEP_0117654480 /NCGR_PEP_ID=MMETSP0804-20121206/3766_1 /TAXON_ID=1074897 /ORGANISM="Tetraselmis astigmatica, Strain CCMP880" /LENGTH=2097 /DNA_ID=CAMNT_0005460763 /DNA_START=186 /DNA_END=6476 /DNA_ORIENTATION=+